MVLSLDITPRLSSIQIYKREHGKPPVFTPDHPYKATFNPKIQPYCQHRINLYIPFGNLPPMITRLRAFVPASPVPSSSSPPAHPRSSPVTYPSASPANSGTGYASQSHHTKTPATPGTLQSVPANNYSRSLASCHLICHLPG